MDGRAEWTFPATYGAAPAVTAVTLDPDPDDDHTVAVALEEVTAWCAVAGMADLVF
ncbi:hypothetical protein [Streptomyces sp. JNUCC 63]